MDEHYPPPAISPDIMSSQGFSKRHAKPMAALARVREHLSKLSPLHEESGGALSRRIESLDRLAERLADRLEWGPEAPLIVAVLGATGTGKSKIFNSLVGRFVSPSGFKRPTTMAPVFYLADGLDGGLSRSGFFGGYIKREVSGRASFDPNQDREIVVIRADDGLPDDLAMVDTPDFDSVLEKNRKAASDVFDRADAVVFVTDAVKYADQASWDYLDRIKTDGKAAVLIVNRLKNPLSLDDFKRRLDEADLDREVLSINDEPGLGDEDLFPADHPVLAEIKNRLSAWMDRRIDLLAAAAEKDWRRLDEELKQGLLAELRHAGNEFTQLKSSIKNASAEVSEDLTRGLTVAISGELKNSLIRQIQGLFLKWDLLRYPRRVMTLPFTLLRDKVLAPLGVMEAKKEAEDLTREIDRLFESNQETLVACVHELNRRAGEYFSGRDIGRGLMERQGFKESVFTADQVREQYAQVRAELEQWVDDQARELVKGLGLGEKMTFYLAQVVSLGLFISIQVHTGGGFSFFDGLLDGVLAPILSKITGSALSKDKVKAFEIQAAQLHQDGCHGIILAQADHYLEYIKSAENGLAPATPLAQAASDLEKAVRSLK